MKISLRQLQIFIAICKSGSTTAAAEIVSLSQSATSASLNELESLLNVELFDRIGKKLVLNENGRQILPQAMQAIDIGNSIQDQFIRQLNYPVASAMSFVLMFIITIAVLIYTKFMGTEDLA